MSCVGVARGALTTLATVATLQAQQGRSDLGGTLARGWALNQSGQDALARGDIDRARSLFHAALTLYRTVDDPQSQAYAMTQLGVIFSKTGQRDSALHYFRSAVPHWRASENKTGLATTLNNIGTLFDEIGQRDSARLYLAQANAPELVAANSTARAITLSNIAAVWQVRGQRDSATVYYRAAFDILKTSGNRLQMARLLNNIGVLNRGDARRGMVDSIFRAALSIQRDIHDVEGEATTLNSLADLFSGSGTVDSALFYYRASLALAHRTANRALEATTSSNIGTVLARAGERDAARIALARASWLRATVATTTPGDALRVVALDDNGNDVTSLWARLAIATPESHVRSRVDTLEAWGALERGRGQALRALRRGGALQEDSLIAMRVSDATRDALVRLARPGRAFVTFDHWRDTLLVLAVSATGVHAGATIRIDSDSLLRLVARTRALAGSRGVQHVAVGRALPIGVVGTTRDMDLELRPSPGAATDSVVPFQLARLLLPPIIRAALRAATELVIIPDGPLSLVPWASLPLDSVTVLGATAALRVVPSLAMLDELSSVAARRQAGRAIRATIGAHALIVGDPAMPPGVPSLPGARAEAHWVADTLFAQQRGRALLIDRDATVRAVRDRLAAATLIHFATHAAAFSDAARSRDSFLQFAAVDSGPSVLTVGELLDAVETEHLTLRARLIVLSACETGTGATSSSEGVLGLQRAFLAMGAETLLVSLWKVDDGATRALMGAFYRHWLDDADGPSAAESLRRAQADLRRGSVPGWQRSWSLPNAWAAFQVVGAG